MQHAQRQSGPGQQRAHSNKKDDSNRSRSDCSQRSQSTKKKKKKKDKHSNRQIKGSHDPIKSANSFESLDDMELDIDPPLAKSGLSVYK